MSDEQNSRVWWGWVARFRERRRDRPSARRRLSLDEAAERAADYLEGR
ncbi:hypothetical protein [Streptomyces kasugaensis]|nr:hypothetical protein [Streptomyces kasugaensis]